MVATRNFIDNSPTTNFPAGLNSSDITAVVSSLVGFPVVFPYNVTLDLGQSTAEVVSFTGAVGLTVTMIRNVNGQGAFAHLSTGTVNHTAVALDYTEANQHHVATSNVHGVTSAVVGINDAQTLTNKTVSNLVAQGVSSSPAATFNVSGTSDGWRVVNAGVTKAKADVNGVVTGNGVVSTSTMTSSGTISITGGALVALGTLTSSAGGLSVATGVNGASATISGNVGAATITASSTIAATGAVTGASFTANGNGVVSGVVVPKSYANQAAALAGAAGQMVYLTAPTGTGAQAGFWTWNAACSIYEPTSGHYAQLRSTATTSIPTGAFTAVAWDTTDYDPCGIVTASQVLAKGAIQYKVSGMVNFAANATGRRLAAVYVNGVIVPGSQAAIPASAITGGPSVVIPPIVVTAAATNVIEIRAFQDSGGALNTAAGCLLLVQRV